jgi:hypothetical protein
MNSAPTIEALTIGAAAIGAPEIARAGARLAARAGLDPPPAWDLRVDTEGLADSPQGLHHAKHQVLMRAYQARYMLLPDASCGGSIVERLQRHYDPTEMASLELLRHGLEAELITPRVAVARQATAGRDLDAYVQALLPELRDKRENPFIAWLRTSPHAEAHYRNFLIQSSADLLAEASASALGVIGEFGPAQSALFRILIDEFGYGAHGRKHSVLYRATLRSFGLCDQYNAWWPLFDTGALELHNAIHHLFQNPRNFFLQVGFLLFAETAYQRSTADHFRYLREFHPGVDARYFAEHAHIDLHHTRMVIEEVAAPLVAAHGPEAGAEIVAGAEFTRRAFDLAGAHMLAVGRAFDIAAVCGKAVYAPPELCRLGAAMTPETALSAGPVPIQVGGIGVLTDARAFAIFPAGAYGRRLTTDA